MECRLRRSTGFGHRGNPKAGQARCVRIKYELNARISEGEDSRSDSTPRHQGAGQRFQECPGDLTLLEKYGACASRSGPAYRQTRSQGTSRCLFGDCSEDRKLTRTQREISRQPADATRRCSHQTLARTIWRPSGIRTSVRVVSLSSKLVIG